MASYRDVVRDDSGYQRPVSGAQVYLLRADSSLATADFNPVETDDFGVFEFTGVPDNVYTLDIRLGGVSYAKQSVTVGTPPQFTGATGPSNNTRLDLAALKAAAITDKTSLYDGSLWTWTLGDFTGQADDEKIVKADSTALSVGAWVRQQAAGVVYQAPYTGAKASTIAAAVAAKEITSADFEIQFTGGDERVKVQAAIDAGHNFEKPIRLYGNLLGIGDKLDLRGRYVDLAATGANSTALVATQEMDRMIDIEEESDVIVSPFFIRNLRIECNNKAAKGIVVRYRHFTEMSGLYVRNATEAAIEEKDAWNNLRQNVVVHGSPIGWNLLGANHNSQWDKCSFATNTAVQLAIGNQGTALDGNMGLIFNGCDVEFGSGKGVTVASGCNVLFNGGYLGENIDQAVFENAGHVMINGGTMFWGWTPNSYFVRPLGGVLKVKGAQWNGQTNGVPNTLINLTNEEVDAGNYGKVSFPDSVVYCAPNAAFYVGDVLAPLAGTAYAPRYGQGFMAYGNGDTVVSSTSNGSSKTMKIETTGVSALAAMRCDLSSGWRKGKRIFYALVYQSTKPVRIRLAQAPFGAAQFVFDAPATSRISTLVVMALIPEPAEYPYIELQPLAITNGDTLTVHKQAFGDSSFLNAADDSAFGNYGLIA